MKPPPPTESAIDRAVRTAIDVLTERCGALSEAVLTIGQSLPLVSINARLVAELGLSPAVADLDDAERLAAVLRCFTDSERFRADVARLGREPGTTIRRDIELVDGRVYDLRGTSILSNASLPLEFRSYFFFGNVSAQARSVERSRYAFTLMQAQLDASPLGIIVTDEAGNLTAYNRRYLEIVDVTIADDASYDHRTTVAHFAAQTTDPDGFLARVRFLYDHPDERGDDELAMNDGRIIRRQFVTLRSPAGESLGRAWFFDDITDLRTSERSARAESDLLTAILDSVPGYLALLDATGRLVRWNEGLRLLNGLTDEQLLGADPFTNVVEDDRPQIAAKIREVISSGAADVEFRVGSARGLRDLRWQGRRISVGGEPHVLAIGVDVSDVYAAEAVRRQSEKRFRDIFESATDGILIVDSGTGAFLDANPQMCAMFGYTLDELLALDAMQISASPSDVLARQTLMLGGAPSAVDTFEWLSRAKNGRDFWTDCSSRRIPNFSGRDVILLMVRDITEQRAAREAVAYRDRIMHALTVSTSNLVKAPSLSASMATLLHAVGEQLGIDRLLVIRRDDPDDPPTDSSITYGWQREGSPSLTFTSTLDAEEQQAVDSWLAPLLSGSPVIAYAVTATGIVRTILEGGGTVSSLLVPIFVDGVWWGYFAVDDTRAIRDWSTVEIDALTTLSDIVGSLIARDRSAAALLESEVQFRTVSDTVLDAIIMIDTEAHVRYWNRAAERIFGYSAAEAIGKPIHEWLAPGRYRAEADNGMARFAATGNGPILGTTVELAAIRKDGVEIDVEFAINPMSVGTALYAVGIARDVTARNAAAAAVGYMATHDLLTDLPNRRHFIAVLNAAIERSKRSGVPFAALALDLDQFKDVNDTLGHPIGDRLLQAVAARLVANVRGIDTVARFGGDEFAAIQTDVRAPADAAALAEKIVTVLGEPFTIDGKEIRSAGSVGIAVYGPDSPDAEALLAHADVALYRAKADGRGIYRFYTEAMDAAVRKRVTIERELREALKLGQLFLVYQPRVDLTDDRIVGVEALARWQHPTRGILVPEQFLPAAEHSGLIVAEGAWAFREACRQTRCWLDDGIVPPIVSINFSALQFRATSDVERTIVETLHEFRVSAEHIELELTESVMMQATQKYSDLLLRLQAMGFHIAIDDFGIGHSSLGNLQRFHVKRITIPRVFLQDLRRDSDGAPIVRATISLARELGITVAAKGVDTAEQVALLRTWGCRLIQGRYSSVPLSAADAGAALTAGVVHPRSAL